MFFVALSYTLCTKSKISIYQRVRKNERQREFVEEDIGSFAIKNRPLMHNRECSCARLRVRAPKAPHKRGAQSDHVTGGGPISCLALSCRQAHFQSVCTRKLRDWWLTDIAQVFDVCANCTQPIAIGKTPIFYS